MIKCSTCVPNYVFDQHLKILTESDLKVLLVIIRQTIGWVGKDGKRKVKDRITNSQFQAKTGLSRRSITKTIQRLIFRKLIVVTDFKGKALYFAKDRKGKSFLYFSLQEPVLLTT